MQAHALVIKTADLVRHSGWADRGSVGEHLAFSYHLNGRGKVHTKKDNQWLDHKISHVVKFNFMG